MMVGAGIGAVSAGLGMCSGPFGSVADRVMENQKNTIVTAAASVLAASAGASVFGFLPGVAVGGAVGGVTMLYLCEDYQKLLDCIRGFSSEQIALFWEMFVTCYDFSRLKTSDCKMQKVLAKRFMMKLGKLRRVCFVTG